MRIKILNQLLANQIAAGEVIERPAAVVKELIENSLDAHAQQLIIDIKQGGHQLIRVRDDGDGIFKDDLLLALARHATSKISQLSDLECVNSLGFRGEALASIGAVSRLKLMSRQRQADTAWCAYSGIDEQTPEPIAHPFGTTIEVNDLFYNTPARRKFLRQPKTEFEQIESVIQKLALSRFNVAFRLTHNQKQILSLTRADTQIEREQRLATILGGAFMEQALYIEYKAGPLQLHGWLALPEFNRSQNDMQYWYLNGRFVRDKLLTHAARQAYEDVLFHGRQPAYVLYLTCDPASVDVNVHPTKHEVRFRDGRDVHQFVVHTVHEALEQIRPGSPLAQQSIIENQPEYHQKKPSQFIPKPLSQSALDSTFTIQEPKTNYKIFDAQPNTLSLGTALAQLRNTFILAQNDQGLVIIDIHAAHERLNYEKIKQQQIDQHPATQPLLVPISLELNRQEYQTWEKNQSQFSAAGIMTEAIGPENILVREIPIVLQNTAIAQIIRDVLADLITHSTSSRIDNTINEILGNIACRGSIQANHSLSIPEMNALLRQMEQTPHSGHCNHGRPTWKQIFWSELDRFFLRGR